MAGLLGALPKGEDLVRWRIVLLCFLAQNCAIGVTYGVFGPLLASTEQHLGASRAEVTTAVGIIGLVAGIASPLLGALLSRVSVRNAMIAGALLCAIAYVGVALTNSLVVMLTLYGVMAVGISIIAILGPVTLVSRWFVTARGKALSIANLPVALLVVPFIVAELLPVLGRTLILQGVASIFFVLALLFWFIVERPAASVAAPGAAAPAQADGSLVLSTGEILRRPAFWLLSAAIGIMAGAGTGFIVHIVPFGVDQKMSLPAASGLLSAFAVAGIAGTLIFGWIADRIGPSLTLAIAAFAQMAIWWAVLNSSGVGLFAAAALMGLCVSPLTTLHGAVMSAMFGAANTSRAMGFSYTVKLPFNFSFAPVLALLYDHFGNYNAPFMISSGLILCAGLLVTAAVMTTSGFRPAAARPKQAGA